MILKTEQTTFVDVQWDLLLSLDKTEKSAKYGE